MLYVGVLTNFARLCEYGFYVYREYSNLFLLIYLMSTKSVAHGRKKFSGKVSVALL